MESKINWNLQDMPQLVIAKIISLLNHNELLVLEQVSKKFKYAIEDYFRTTDHLILGSLASIDKLEENKKLLQLIQRCGIRLRTIQFNVNVNKRFIDEIWHMEWLLPYIDHLFESGGEVISKTCPNIEHIITSPKMDTKSTLFDGQVVGLSLAESYANHLHKMGNKCKLRAIRINFEDDDDELAEKKFKAIVDCYSNLKHILLSRCNDKQFLRYLPQLIKNGLEDLKIDDYYMIEFQDIVEYCKIGINLQTLSFAVNFESNDDIASINQLKLPKGLELEIFVNDTSSLASLNENVCDSVVKLLCSCDDISECNSMIKLKNLREFGDGTLEHIKLLAKESFPKLKQVDLWVCCNPCDEALTKGYRNSVCDLIFLPELLTSKGDQLTDISMEVCSSLDLVVKAVRYCKAALNVNLTCALDLNHCTTCTSITIEDIMAILQLPRLQKFSIIHIVKTSSVIDDLIQKMKIVENGQTNFKFEYDVVEDFTQRSYVFERIDI